MCEYVRAVRIRARLSHVHVETRTVSTVVLLYSGVYLIPCVRGRAFYGA